MSRLVLNLGSYLDGTPIVSFGSSGTYLDNEVTGMTGYSEAPRFAPNEVVTGQTDETIVTESSNTRHCENDIEMGAFDSRGQAL